MSDQIVVRIAEIFLKGKNRRRFLTALIRNARWLLADLDGVTVEPQYLRLVVRHPPALRRQCIQRLERLFGMSSLSPAIATECNLDAISEIAVAKAREYPAGTTFKVDTRRRDKRFPMSSPEVSREIGGRIVQATGLPVDVHNPARTIEVEINEDGSFVYTERVAGPGGLPTGVSGCASLLLSGGIDSPVAGWSAMRRGCRITATYFHSFPYTGDKTKEKVLEIARLLAEWQGRLAVHVVHFTDVQKALREHITAEYAVIGYRRMMMRAATRLARVDNASALVTGENLGQVASQTLMNLGTIEAASDLPVLRPLITFDKAEIVARAQAIGTFETSILPYDDCCSLFVPKHPATRVTAEEMAKQEHGLDVEAMADSLADGAERIVVGRGDEAGDGDMGD